MRVIIERPADRHFDQPAEFAEHGGFFELDYVAPAYAVRRVIVSHHAAIVDKIVLEQQIDRMRAQIPRRRTITTRVASSQDPDLLISAHEARFLLLARQLR